jgi:hypothetical protein
MMLITSQNMIMRECSILIAAAAHSYLPEDRYWHDWLLRVLLRDLPAGMPLWERELRQALHAGTAGEVKVVV